MLLFVTGIEVLGGLATVQPLAAQAAASDWERAAGGKMKFDVVSVKRSTSDEVQQSVVPLGPGNTYVPDGGFFSATRHNLLEYIMFAYKISSVNDLRGVPDWAGSEDFDIDARSAANPTKDQMRLMVQSVLADRFKLSIRLEIKSGPVFVLVLSKPGKLGPNLHPSSEASCSAVARNPDSDAANNPAVRCGDFTVVPPTKPGQFRLVGRNVPIDLIARQLPSGALAGVNRPVFNGTGLYGNFDFSIEWMPRLPVQPSQFNTDEPGPTFSGALGDQLGLKLVPQTGPISIFVIEHVEEPSPN